MNKLHVPVGADHLGGYVEGGDEATFYPDLWHWCVNELGAQTILDVGCGDGVAVSYFNKIGASAIGLDGVPQEHPSIITHDFTKGPAPDLGEFDLVWSCEFVEHVEAKYVPNVVSAFQQGKVVLMTHAYPDQPGHHHVNCQTSDYWTGVMSAAGFTFNTSLTVSTKSLARKNDSPWNHYARSGLGFIRN